ncbi:MAG TPA: glycoside hydrolase family 18 protein [Rudaea sp.]|jgi:chitinase|nr:glycoside hydrolase family 18 protein [Rudaea sp.]
MPFAAAHSARRRFALALSAAAIAGLLLALAGCPANNTGSSTKAQYRLVGYVAGWEKSVPIAAEKLTAINYAFAHVSDGRVVLDQPGAAEGLKGLYALRMRNPRLQILVSVGGWGADGFSDAALTDASRLAFAQSAAELIAQHGLDGIDLDWEYPGLPGPGIVHRDEDKTHFTLLLQALRQQLDALGEKRQRRADTHYLLTAALADGEFTKFIELDRIHAYLDWIDLMTYDFHNSLTPTTGHHAALRRSATSAETERSLERAVSEYLAAGVPARKIVVGVPFYGRAFADVTAENNGLDQTYGKYEGDHPWPQLVADFIDHNGYARHWDATAQVPYLWNAQTRVFVSYDDPQSLKLKAEFVKSNGLGGMMYWEQSQDPRGELLGVLSAALR